MLTFISSTLYPTKFDFDFESQKCGRDILLQVWNMKRVMLLYKISVQTHVKLNFRGMSSGRKSWFSCQRDLKFCAEHGSITYSMEIFETFDNWNGCYERMQVCEIWVQDESYIATTTGPQYILPFEYLYRKCQAFQEFPSCSQCYISHSLWTSQPDLLYIIVALCPSLYSCHTCYQF